MFKLSYVLRVKNGNQLLRRHISQEITDRPLSGIKILDLTRIIAGPYCTMILGDLGADVYKIERLGIGDECRQWGPPFITGSNTSIYFASVNRNKKSICIDFRTECGREIIYDLAKKCDVLVENYLPGKLDKYKIGYDNLKEIAPHLIYCSITGYGSKGPYSNRPGYDQIAAARGGFLHITGPMGGEPVKCGVAITDVCTGLYAHGAIMAALLKRNRTKKGQKIDCNLLSTQLSVLINIGGNYLNAGIEAKRLGTSHASLVPYEAFPTKDGYVTICCGSNMQWADFCKRLNISEFINDKRFESNSQRVINRDQLVPILRKIFKEKTKNELMNIFEGASFPYGPVNTLEETFDDTHVKEIGIVKTLTHEKLGPVKVVGSPVVYSEDDDTNYSPIPILGEHTNEILTNILNYDDTKIQQLKNQKVIQ